MRRFFFFLSKLECVRIEGRRSDDLEKVPLQGPRGGRVDRSVDGDDSAEGGDRIGVERFPNRQTDVRTLRDAAGNGMLDDGRANEALAVASELRSQRRAREQPQRGVEIEQIIVRERLSVQLLGQTLGPVEIECRPLLRIRAVAQPFREPQRQCERAGKLAWQDLARRCEIVRDCDVVLRGSLVGRDCKLPAHCRRRVARLDRRLVFRVLRRVRQHGDVVEVLCRRSQQRNAADIDLLDRFFFRRPPARDRFFEGIEIHDDRADLRNGILLRLRAMLGVGAIEEYRTENLGVQRFDAPAEERRKTGHVLDVSGAYACVLEERSGSTGCVDFDAALLERVGPAPPNPFCRRERRAPHVALPRARQATDISASAASSAETIALTPASLVVTPYRRSALSIVFLLCVTMSI